MVSGEETAKSLAQQVRDYVAAHPRATNKGVAEALEVAGTIVTPDYVREIRRRQKAGKTGASKKVSQAKSKTSAGASSSSQAKFPRHPLERVLRIPRAILDQNAGRQCTIKEAAGYLGLTSASGEFQTEVSSARKFGLIDSAGNGQIAVSDLARKILRPQTSSDETDGLREAALKAPDIAELYNYYRNENLPDDKYLDNTLLDKLGIPEDKLTEFKDILFATLRTARLVEERDGKIRILDTSKPPEAGAVGDQRLKRLERDADVSPEDTCFVMTPFAEPYDMYYDQVYEQAIEKAGLRSVRADNSIFGAGKIMDQIWRGINQARVLVAELTTKNPNVFYELGIAHALHKPVVLVSSNDGDVPFDLQPIRVIYYDVNDPFWGQKLIEKIAENILSAIKNPEEAVFRTDAAE